MPLRPAFTPARAGLALLCAAALAGCASVGPDYRQPALKLPASWQAALPHEGNTSALLDWWAAFQDPTLDSLLRAAETDSPTLDKAAAAIASARASTDSATASLYPSLDASASLTRSGTAKSGSSTSKLTSAGGLDASWEIDLFGSVRRNREAARARLAASQADWHDARVSLAAEVADEYVSYRACQLLTESYRSNLASLRRTASTTEVAVSAGLSAPADGALATASAASAAASLVSQQAECDISIKALVALTGLDEGPLRQQLGSSPARIPEPANLQVSSLPVQLLSQRPDLVSAERSLAAASADIGVAEANRYPRLSLAGSISLSRSGGSSGTETAPWSFGPSLSLPLFDGGSLRAAVASAEASYASALAGYRDAVRTAVKESEQALVNLDAANRRSEDLATSAREYRRYFEASQILWQAGGTSLLSLEEARRSALSAEQNLIAVQRDRVLYGIALYKALGGGWQADQASTTGAAQ